MDKFEQKEMKKKRSIKNTWYDSLIDYFLEPILKIIGGFQDKILSLFKTNTPEDYGKQNVYGKREKPSKLEIQKQSEDNMIKNIRSIFKLTKENNTMKDYN